MVTNHLKINKKNHLTSDNSVGRSTITSKSGDTCARTRMYVYMYVCMYVCTHASTYEGVLASP